MSSANDALFDTEPEETAAEQRRRVDNTTLLGLTELVNACKMVCDDESLSTRGEMYRKIARCAEEALAWHGYYEGEPSAAESDAIIRRIRGV